MGFIHSIGSLFSKEDKLPQKYDTDVYYAYAQKQEAKGNLQGAIECYEIIYSHDKSHYETYDRLFRYYELTKQWAKLKELAESFNEHLWYLKMDHWKEYHNKATNGIWEEEQKKKSANKEHKAKSQELKVVKTTTPKDERKFVGSPNPKDYKREEDMPVMRQFLTKDGREFVWTKEATITFDDYNRIQKNIGKPELVSLKRTGHDTYLDYVNPVQAKEDTLFDDPPTPATTNPASHQLVMVNVVNETRLPTEPHFTMHSPASVMDFVKEQKMQLPEFDFYTGDASETFKQNTEPVQKLSGLNERVSKDYSRVLFYLKENYKDYAVKALEEMVSFDLPSLKHHVKLMEFYHEMGWFDTERTALDQIIKHYEVVRADNLREFLSLADKYKSRAYADKKVAEGKRVAYFDNLYDVYNPYTELDTLKKMRKELY